VSLDAWYWPPTAPPPATIPCGVCGARRDRTDLLEAYLPERNVQPYDFTVNRLSWVCRDTCSAFANDWQPGPGVAS
jgi:hypothetical protein